MLSIELLSVYKSLIFELYVKFVIVDYCFIVVEGKLKVELEGLLGENVFYDGEILVIFVGQGFKLSFVLIFVKVLLFMNGLGIEMLIQEVGKLFEGFVLLDKVEEVNFDKFVCVCKEINVMRV